MNLFDGLYYTYYWRYRNAGDSKCWAVFRTLITLGGITTPYVAIIWYLPLLLPDHFIDSLGIEIPMYVGFFLVFVFLCIRLAWGKRAEKIISQHNLYDNEKYKRLGKRGIIAFGLGWLIFIGISWIVFFHQCC